MNDGRLTVSNSEFGKLDILVEDGKELFPANDAAKILGYSVPHGAIQKHCRGCLKRTVTDSLGRTTEKNFITEGDLYRLIIRSRLPAAQKFEKWLFDEVLPELRRTGGYRAKPAADLPHQWMGRGCIRIDDAAKLLGVKKEKIRDLLHQRKTVYRSGVDWETTADMKWTSTSFTIVSARLRSASALCMTAAWQSAVGTLGEGRRIPRCRWRRKSRCCPRRCRRRMNSCGSRWRKSGKLQENWGSEENHRREAVVFVMDNFEVRVNSRIWR